MTLPGTAMDAAVRIACLPPPAQIEEIARIVQSTLDVAQAKFASQLADQLDLRPHGQSPQTPAPTAPATRRPKKPTRQGNS